MAASLDRRARLVRRCALAALVALASFSAAAVLMPWSGVPSAVLGALLLPPLLMPLRGMLRGDRRTYAWATLCAVPGFVYGITEAVANPAMRWLAALVLGSSIAFFLALVAFLRVTRPRPGQSSPSP
ncbi:MAG TPA: DUF2069 domain-containing protein [Steroidobacteraceae bacterium]|nr:DUF2069 domain-containing protein [Steroidobacteraceae bacterium]